MEISESPMTLCGPFITVVSVDGGLPCGNKLTVITPTEIIGKNSHTYVHNPAGTPSTSTTTTTTSNGHNGQIGEFINHEKNEIVEDFCGFGSNSNSTNKSAAECNGKKSAYITILDLHQDLHHGSDDTGTDEDMDLVLCNNKQKQRSIINISNEIENDTEIETIKNYELLTQAEIEVISAPKPKARLSRSVSESGKKVKKCSVIDDQLVGGGGKIEEVQVQRIPGQRLGFGLRFEGGGNSAENPNQMVRELFVQSCVVDSPAGKVLTSWGGMAEGDQILAINCTPVTSMTRIGCVQTLKDTTEFVKLLIRHGGKSRKMISTTPHIIGEVLKKPRAVDNTGPCADQGIADVKRPKLVGDDENLNVDLNERGRDKVKTPPPQAPPRKSSKTRQNQDLKPPVDFADNAMTVETAANYYNALDDHQISESDDLESITSRSTVVSRLSVQNPADDFSNSKNNQNHSTNANTSISKPGAIVMNEKMKNAPEVSKSNSICNSTSTSETDDETILRKSAEIPLELEPPLVFQDDLKNVCKSVVQDQEKVYPHVLVHDNNDADTIVIGQMGICEMGNEKKFICEGQKDSGHLTNANANGDIDCKNNLTSTSENHSEGVRGVASVSVQQELDDDHDLALLAEELGQDEYDDDIVMMGEDLNNLSYNLDLNSNLLFSDDDGTKNWPNINNNMTNVMMTAEDSQYNQNQKLVSCSQFVQNQTGTEEFTTTQQQEKESLGNKNDEFSEPSSTTSRANDVFNNKNLNKSLIDGEVEAENNGDLRSVGNEEKIFLIHQQSEKQKQSVDEQTKPTKPTTDTCNEVIEPIIQMAEEKIIVTPTQMTEELFQQENLEISVKVINKNEIDHNEQLVQGQSDSNLVDMNLNLNRSDQESDPEEPEDQVSVAISRDTIFIVSDLGVIKKEKKKSKIPIRNLSLVGKVQLDHQNSSNFGGQHEVREETMVSTCQVNLKGTQARHISNNSTKNLENSVKGTKAKAEIVENSEKESNPAQDRDHKVQINKTESNLGLKDQNQQKGVPVSVSLEEGVGELAALNLEGDKKSQALVTDNNVHKSSTKVRFNDQILLVEEKAAEQEQFEGSSCETVMDASSTEYLHQFIPPPAKFSHHNQHRSPPDGSENVYSWSDGIVSTSVDSSKMHFRTELNLKDHENSLVVGSPPPPPLPMSEPPLIDDFTYSNSNSRAQPQVPYSNYNPQGRKSSIDEKRRIFEQQQRDYEQLNMNQITTTPPVPARQNGHHGAEPSVKSVRDKISLFTTKIEDASPTDPSSPSSLKTPFSKSSGNLLESFGAQQKQQQQQQQQPQFHNSTQSTLDRWKMNKSTFDLTTTTATTMAGGLGRKNSIDSTISRPIGQVSGNGHGPKQSFYERSQSMTSVQGVDDNTSYHKFKYNNHNNSNSNKSAANIMEARRKCLNKLKGLVIPDSQVEKNEKVVPNLPTIISKDGVTTTPTITTPNKSSLSLPAKNLLGNNLLMSSGTNYNSNIYMNINNNNNSNNNSAKQQQQQKTNNIEVEISNSFDDFQKFNNVLPKYSPAFKRRGFSAYQHQHYQRIEISQQNGGQKKSEPKSLESLTSPRSDSSFEFSSNHSSTPSPQHKTTQQIVQQKVVGKNGKMDDSDNDSAVSSSRSSISHGLSPPNSPTPADGGRDRKDSDLSKDESWRILKAQSVEAINRKNVLTSAKFSVGIAPQQESDENSQQQQQQQQQRRSDDENFADDSSSCSELENGGKNGGQKSIINHHQKRKTSGAFSSSHNSSGGKYSADTEEDDEEYDEEIEIETPPTHTQTMNLNLDESPLQAIFDLETKMTYINEICNGLPARNCEPSRYTSYNGNGNGRRDSDSTIISEQIQPQINERKSSTTSRVNNNSAGGDKVDSSIVVPAPIVDRRERNRSSSGNESDFSSGISSGKSRDSTLEKIEPAKWSLLEKKYSKSTTSVNLLGKSGQTVGGKTSAEIVEKKIEKYFGKSTGERDPIRDSCSSKVVKAPLIAGIPKTRNDFKSLAEKWQNISNSPEKSGDSSTGMLGKSMQMRTSSELNLSKISSKLDIVESPSPRKTMVPEIKKEIIQPPISSGNSKRSVSVLDIRKAFEKAEMSVRDDAIEPELSTPKVEIPAISPNTSTLSVGGGDKELKVESPDSAASPSNGLTTHHVRISSFDSTTSDESSAPTPVSGIYGSVNSLLSSAPRDFGSITSLASSTSLISPQELQQLIDEANLSLEEAGNNNHEVAVVILHREFAGGSLGITLAGGADYETKEITVHKVINNSLADRDGRIHRCDRVLSINGKSTKGLTHRDALNLLKAPRAEVVLVVSRGRASNGFKTIDETGGTTGLLDRAVEPLLNGSLSSFGLENDDDGNYKWGPPRTVTLVKDGAGIGGLGYSLEGGKGSITGDKPLTIKKIFIGGPAEKSKDLKLGDLIVSINSVNMNNKSRTEAWNFMKKLGDGEIKIVVRSPIVS